MTGPQARSLSAQDWAAVGAGLHYAANSSADDIECDVCIPDDSCPEHADAWANVLRWRWLAARLDAQRVVP